MDKKEQTVQVKIPDLFVHFLARKPQLHESYGQVRVNSEAWLSNICEFAPDLRKIVNKIDFTYFVAIILPHADPERFRTACDWGNWIFPFDDELDGGELKEKPVEVRQLVDGLTDILNEKTTNKFQYKLLTAFESIWLRVTEDAHPGTKERLSKSMREYCEAVFQQVVLQNGTREKQLSVQSNLRMRRQSIATTPLYAFVEYANGLQIPDYVFGSRSIKEIEQIGTDLVILQNDLVSYPKEKALGESHNIITIYQNQGYSIQESFDQVGNLLSTCYRNWYRALAELPSWGEEIDAQVQLYIDGVQNTALANIHWSFRADRYWKDNDQVRKSKVIHLPVDSLVQQQTSQCPDILKRAFLPGFIFAAVLGLITAVPTLRDSVYYSQSLK